MARREQSSLSSGTLVAPTRLAGRRSLRISTDQLPKLPLDSPFDTPTSRSTDRSTNLNRSPTSSRTSLSTLDPAEALSSVRCSPAQAQAQDHKMSTRRSRKPTQKAQELAANPASKLYKTQNNEDTKSPTEDVSVASTDDAAAEGDEVGAESEHLGPQPPVRRSRRNTATSRAVVGTDPSSEASAVNAEQATIVTAAPTTSSTRKRKRNVATEEKAGAGVRKTKIQGVIDAAMKLDSRSNGENHRPGLEQPAAVEDNETAARKTKRRTKKTPTSPGPATILTSSESAASVREIESGRAKSARAGVTYAPSVRYYESTITRPHLASTATATSEAEDNYSSVPALTHTPIGDDVSDIIALEGANSEHQVYRSHRRQTSEIRGFADATHTVTLAQKEKLDAGLPVFEDNPDGLEICNLSCLDPAEVLIAFAEIATAMKDVDYGYDAVDDEDADDKRIDEVIGEEFMKYCKCKERGIKPRDDSQDESSWRPLGEDIPPIRSSPIPQPSSSAKQSTNPSPPRSVTSPVRKIPVRLILRQPKRNSDDQHQHEMGNPDDDPPYLSGGEGNEDNKDKVEDGDKDDFVSSDEEEADWEPETRNMRQSNTASKALVARRATAIASTAPSVRKSGRRRESTVVISIRAPGVQTGGRSSERRAK